MPECPQPVIDDVACLKARDQAGFVLDDYLHGAQVSQPFPVFPIGVEADAERSCAGQRGQYNLGQGHWRAGGLDPHQDAAHWLITEEIQLTQDLTGIVLLGVVSLPGPGIAPGTGLQEC